VERLLSFGQHFNSLSPKQLQIQGQNGVLVLTYLVFTLPVEGGSSNPKSHSLWLG